jgi:hypothetical protein
MDVDEKPRNLAEDIKAAFGATRCGTLDQLSPYRLEIRGRPFFWNPAQEE